MAIDRHTRAALHQHIGVGGDGETIVVQGALRLVIDRQTRRSIQLLREPEYIVGISRDAVRDIRASDVLVNLPGGDDFHHLIIIDRNGFLGPDEQLAIAVRPG